MPFFPVTARAYAVAHFFDNFVDLQRLLRLITWLLNRVPLNIRASRNKPGCAHYRAISFTSDLDGVGIRTRGDNC
jgi:hypothetical protein